MILHCSFAISRLVDSFTTIYSVESSQHTQRIFGPAPTLLFPKSWRSKSVTDLCSIRNDNGENVNEDENAVNLENAKERRKEQIGKAAARIIKRDDDSDDENDSLFKLNPFRAGQNLRKTFDSAITSLARASSTPEDRLRKNSAYYLDDRFGGALFTQESNPYLARLQAEKYIPEVLVVGATGEVGRLVVRRLLLEGRSQVRPDSSHYLHL